MCAQLKFIQIVNVKDKENCHELIQLWLPVQYSIYKCRPFLTDLPAQVPAVHRLLCAGPLHQRGGAAPRQQQPAGQRAHLRGDQGPGGGGGGGPDGGRGGLPAAATAVAAPRVRHQRPALTHQAIWQSWPWKKCILFILRRKNVLFFRIYFIKIWHKKWGYTGSFLMHHVQKFYLDLVWSSCNTSAPISRN